MKILSVTAQKPDSTGSGVYLAELVKEFEYLGHEQAVIAGVYKTDVIPFSTNVKFYPLYFKTNNLPFAIAGMSDEMPYESTVYGQMTPEMVDTFECEFKRKIREAVEDFNPDIIVCHHLYLVTSLVRELYPNKKVFGFCHNTDLRQMKKIPLERAYIKEQIQKLDKIFALHKEQKQEIMNVYEVPEFKILIAGAGYNQHVFYSAEITDKEQYQGELSEKQMDGNKVIRLIFAGKLSEKKGIISLIKSLSLLKELVADDILFELALAGGYGREEEYAYIQSLAKEAPYKVEFLGRLPHDKLAKEYQKSDVFVLPSFYEGLPMVVIEAMACGNRVVVTDLPGVRPWIEENVEHAPVVYVPMPEMKNTDEPVEESLPIFERQVAEAIIESSKIVMEKLPDLSRVSWSNICSMVIFQS